VEKRASLQAAEFRRERVTYGNVTPLNTEKVTTDEVLEERSRTGGTGMPLFYFLNFAHIKVKPRFPLGSDFDFTMQNRGILRKKAS